MKKTTICTIAIFLIITKSHAESIKQRTYDYKYDDGAVGMPDQTYLVCNNCQDDVPTKKLDLIVHASMDLMPVTPAPVVQTASIVTYVERPASVAETVHFNFDSAVLLPESIKKLNGLVPNNGLYLEGYTCTIGTDKYNLGLSQRRADAVRNFLKKRGLSILSALGRGKSTLYLDKPLNRRVEIFERRENGS